MIGAPQVKSPPCQFEGQRHCNSGDIMVLVCHMILQDYITKGSCDYIVKSPSMLSYQPTFGGHRHCDTRVVMVLWF